MSVVSISGSDAAEYRRGDYRQCSKTAYEIADERQVNILIRRGTALCGRYPRLKLNCGACKEGKPIYEEEAKTDELFAEVHGVSMLKFLAKESQPIHAE